MSRPNVLIIHTDQQSSWSLGCYGGTLLETPHVDRIAEEGVRFDQFFTNSAVCTPSRGCFMTGRYPHSNGAYRNNLPLNRDEITFAEVLRQNGYRTGYVGKWHLDGDPRPGWLHPERSMGFEDCEFMFNRGHWKKIEDRMKNCSPFVEPYHVMGDEETYTTDYLASKTIEVIERGDERPFCTLVSVPDPHDPFTVREPYASMFSPEDMELPSTFCEEHIPGWLANVRERQPYAMANEDRVERLKKSKAGYLGEVKCIDDNVGRLLAFLDEKGVLDNTLVVYTTDHGEYMGEHGLYSKNLLYETAYRIPLLMRLPGTIPAGTVVDRITDTVDFQKTLLGLLGIQPSGREQGKDASAFARGEETDWTDESFIHHCSHNHAGIFTPEFELAYSKGSGAMLFDRKNDPEQVNNLFDNPEYSETVKNLTERIKDHNTSVGAPASEWLEEVKLQVSED